ncbi:putative NRPS-like protein biosynthetic cluster [Aspergillus chevalieri]|uniref:Putative NRPS-like protein biosynthetic cluster n=1 Tax=Aspergillus chevalieri TaxID=182096 RepID=A0A7R7VMT3_ASPCH|nr:putative NRPS-like protein biosynthetic cluster [Aspergillus chevalieri]BCR87540.1 putative NRPS-like protein biosynthetic cluster [Aspergillus chevalieri]
MSIGNLQQLLEAVSAEEGSGNVIAYSQGNLGHLKVYSYKQVLEAAQKASWALRSRGETYRPGSVILLHFEAHWDAIVWFWATLFAGCIPCMSTALSNNSAIRLNHLEHLSKALINPSCLTTSTLLHEFADQEHINPIPIESLNAEKATSDELNNINRESKQTDVALLMLTSGSSGNSKAVCLTHHQIFTAIAGKYSVIELPEGTSFLNWIRLDHVAAIVEIHLQALFARKDQIHVQAPDFLADPLQYVNLIDKHRVSRTFAPNFFLAKLRAALQGLEAQNNPRNWDLSCLKYIASGGEANVVKTCDVVSQLLSQYGAPAHVIVPGFGMTETCAGSIFNTKCPTYDKERSLEFTSVGACMPGIKMRITEGSNNETVPAGVVGNLEISGPVVFKSYFNNPTATEESFSSDGWFKTGDKGSIDETGYLTLQGRAKEAMIINGVKYNPHEIETALDESKIPGLTPSFNCCFSYFPAGCETEEICVTFLPSFTPEDTVARVETVDAISKSVMMATGSKAQVLPLDRSQLQKSALGKLSRNKIKTAYQKGEYRTYEDINNETVSQYRAATRQNPQNELEQQLLDIFIRCLGLPENDFDIKTPVFNMGITSVELIKLKKNIEEHLDLTQEIPMITLMTNTTVHDLAKALYDLQAPHEYNPVVTLQSQGYKTPLWLIHPGVGEVLVFLNLAKFIVDRKVYALRARGFNESEQPFQSIPEVASTYHTAIKQKQPEGPYALAGYSYGSMLAFEVGKLLESNCDKVSFLGSFNLPPHIKTRMRQLDWKECLLHLSYFLDLMTEAHARKLAAELRGATREQAMAKVMEDADQDRLFELALSPEALNKWATLAFALQSMAVDYDPSGSIASMDVFYCIPLAVVASSKEQWRNEHLSKWVDFTRSEPRFHEVGGAHYTMLGPEHVFNFQKTLRAALDARGI